ncbi:hypothetical protein EW146_g3149 [Bondarzewia mesenterica]|uniref:ubiquitinyl hydrolase 1 n=1 Tax=Bondarzewia mesenterica TaxID=1095465 RepID=A0A4S4LYR5_9AGAM|nr:hypothetical protein EW146_g3149 [Bondarzewia mesenterica]
MLTLERGQFTAPDLSSIARSLDALEQTYSDGDENRASTNMDDTGVWGLSLTRWRSEAMKPYQDRPHMQLAFILNLEQHWFTLRRFGSHSTREPGQNNGHWFNLNSFLEKPEWVSKTYLGMVLQQAESEGYSVFVVAPTSATAPLSLPRCAADELAQTLPEPSSAASSSRLSTTRTPHAPEGLEHEDYDLQAALQASLASGTFSGWERGPPIVNPASGSSGTRTPHASASTFGSSSSSLPPPAPAPAPEPQPSDPITASMARNQALLQRMQREQEYMLQEQYEEEVARMNIGVPRALGRPTETQGEEGEDELLRRAIAESEALARQREQAEDDMDVDVEGAEERRSQQPSRGPSAHLGGAVMSGDRVYDDDDEQLQAALKASLESVPAGFRVPELPASRAFVQPPATSIPSAGASDQHVRTSSMAETETETESEPETGSEVPTGNEQKEDLNLEEMRRRRLARFG